MAELTISSETVCFIILKARGLEAKVPASGQNTGSNPADQGIDDERPYLSVLEDESAEQVVESLPEGAAVGPDASAVPETADDEAVDASSAAALEGGMADAGETEFADEIASLNEDEVVELIGLMRLGRDDTATVEDWPEILAEVSASQTVPPEDYLLGTPLLAEYLEAGLEKFGISCVESAAGERG